MYHHHHHRPQNDYSRVNTTGKTMRKSNFDQLNTVPHPPQPQQQQQTQVYIIDKNDFKSLVQQLTSPPQSFERLVPQIHHKTIQDPTLSVPPSAAQEDPDVSLYMRYLQSCLLEESSGSNVEQFQQPFDNKYESHVMVHSPTEVMSQCNGYEQVVVPNSTSWFNGSPQNMHGDGASSLQSTGVDYSQPNFTYSSMTQPGGGFGPDLDGISLDEIFDVPYELN
ncbi:hypothetical protein CARUB_v10012318mg [Capsella rubella]|uniref:VQ domain-containing protein n=1 Tax=Capsella rubella TaxID=81985 RepID=R0IL65_9BRAS|nr:VQ motif-containing protein 5 [Capsella rubella]EOA39300.1 hypothetical protein CARUB_v10012318mg [Capsella rubella]